MKDVSSYRLKLGSEFPYDAPDSWWESDGKNPPPSTDWAHRAARGILSDLTGRRAIKNGFDGVDEAVRAEIVATIAGIIRAAQSA